MIEVRCLHALSAAAPYRAAINTLNLGSARPDPFATFEFYENFLESGELLAHGGQLWLLMAFCDDELLGYLALKRSVHRVLGVSAAKLDLLTAYVGDRPQLVARADHAQAVSAAMYVYLLDRKKDWSLLEFQQQDSDSPLLMQPANSVRRVCQVRRWPNSANGIIPIEWTSLAGYFATFSKKFRSNVSRQMRTLMAAGDLQMLTAQQPQQLAAAFELYCSIEARSWKSRTDTAFRRDQKWLAYYRGLMQPAQPMQLSIQLLLLDGLPIAGLINGAFGEGLYALHIVYDERLARLAPGSAILLLGVRMAISGGYKFFNLLWGYGYYKARWLAQMSETQSLQIYRIGSPYYWRRLLGDLKRRWLRTANSEAGVLSNPARREVDHDDTENTGTPTTLFATPDERACCAKLIAQVNTGRGACLSASELAAAMPFETRITKSSRLRPSTRLGRG